MGKRVEIDGTGISSNIFLQYLIGSWLDELGMVSHIVYVVQSLFRSTTSVVQVGATSIEC